MTQGSSYPHNMSEADLLKAIEAVANGAKRRVIYAYGKPLEIAPHKPVKRSPKVAASARPRSKRFSLKDPLWEINGIVNGPGPSDVAANKDSYLAEAYAPKHR